MHPLLALAQRQAALPLAEGGPPGGRPPGVTTQPKEPPVGGDCLSWGPGYVSVPFKGKVFCMHESEVNQGLSPCDLERYRDRTECLSPSPCDEGQVAVTYKGQTVCMRQADIDAGLTPCDTNPALAVCTPPGVPMAVKVAGAVVVVGLLGWLASRLLGGGYRKNPTTTTSTKWHPGGFDKLVGQLEAKGYSEPRARAIAASIGRSKYGQAEMTRRSKLGKTYRPNPRMTLREEAAHPMTSVARLEELAQHKFEHIRALALQSLEQERSRVFDEMTRPRPRMLELFSGTRNMSKAFAARGWDTVTVELNERFEADFRDVREFSAAYGSFDFIWASPPCTEYSSTAQPWHNKRNKGKKPDPDLLKHTLRIIGEVGPRYYAIENVQGAIKWFEPYVGNWILHGGSIYLWGKLPRGTVLPGGIVRHKMKASGDPRYCWKRSVIPLPIANAVADAVDAAVRKEAATSLVTGT